MRVNALSLAVLSASAVGANAETDCVEGLHLILARGTGDDPPPLGVMGSLGKSIAENIEDSDVVGLDYPASMDYLKSETEGAESMRELVLDYHKSCPDTKIAVMGYSQGAQLTADAFCGGDGGSFNDVEPIPSDIVDGSVVAIVLLGDPSQAANASFNHGTATNDGLFVRHDSSICEGYGKRIVSYCDVGDVWCDNKGENRSVHASYLATYGKEIKEFIINQYNEAVADDGQDDNASSTTASPAPTPSPSATTGNGTSTTASVPSSTSTNTNAPTEAGDPGSAAAGLGPATGLLVLGLIALLPSLL